MVHYQIIYCPHCQGKDLQKNGKSPNGTRRWYCKECKKYFRIDYLYNACKPGVKDKITEMTLNGSGVREIGRVLGISRNTVCSDLKKNVTGEPLLFDRGRVQKDERLGG
jgi:transposase-like protein